MICKYCGFNTRKNSKFCENCGAALLDDDDMCASSHKFQDELKENTYSKQSSILNIHDEMRKRNVKEAEEFFSIPESDTEPIDGYSETKRTDYNRSGSIRRTNPFVELRDVKNIFNTDPTSSHKKKKATYILISFSAIFVVVIIAVSFIFSSSVFTSNISNSYLSEYTYELIEIGMTYDEVVECIGKSPSNTMTYSSSIGNMKQCTWQGDIGHKAIKIIVTFTDGIATDKQSQNL